MKFVKSYQGKRSDEPSEKVASLKVSDYMATKLITFGPDQRMHEVIEILLKNRISGAPVINEENELVGIVSEGDCLRQISESQYHNFPISEGKVSDYMVRNVITIDGNMSIFDAASRFLKSKIRRFPVVENGKVVGQISQKDVMKAVLDLKAATWNK